MAVLITGASSGIGEACARAFASAQMPLILVARREDRLNFLSEELRERFQIPVHAFGLDVRDRVALALCIKAHPEVFKTVKVLINNAGLAKGLDPIQNGKPEDWDVVIDTNIKGLLNVTHALLPSLIANKGHIVNLGSVAGHWVYQKGAVYCATKFAVNALTQGFRMDLNGTGVRVTEISPGMVETEFSQVRLEDSERAKAVYADKNPLTPGDIAEAILWCVQRPARVNIQELVIFPTEQPGVGNFSSKASV